MEVVAGAFVGATINVMLENLITFPVEEIGLILKVKGDLQKLKASIVMIQDFLEDAEMKQVTDKAVQRWLMKLEAVAYDADYVFDQLNYQLLRNKVAKKVSSFFSRYNPLAFRLKVAGKIKEINNELKSINKEARALGLQMRTLTAHARRDGTVVQGYLETDSFSVDPVFMGREDDVAEILEMVTTAQTQEVVTVLPIVGMGGLGKTTLTRKVYNDQTIISHFGKRVWVHVGKNFDPVIVLKKTLESLTGENVDGSREVVLRKLRMGLGEEKYLLVLDDVWNEDDQKWNNFVTSLKGISLVKGNVIMVTTRSGNVASLVKTRNIHELGVLSEEDCWLIIKAGAFGGEDAPSEFETIGKNIVKKCGGLPLAAQVIGSLLRGKLEDEWVSIEKNWLLDSAKDENAISKSLKLSFDNLSPLLKKCFAYCSIMPKGWVMEGEELIELWIAEGFLQRDKVNDMEILGKNVFNILLQSSLLQVWRRDLYGNVELCGLHDLVHDFSSSVLNPNSPDNTYLHCHISLPCKNESCPISKEHARYLRALFYNGNVSDIIFSNFKRLHVLILIDEDIVEMPFEIGNLICLRYLDISYTKMESLPDSLGHLYHLETLRATKIYGGESCLRRLPDTLKYLTNLRHLYIPNIKVPRDIRNLISIQTLPYFQVGDEEGCGIVELGCLKNLKGAIEIHKLEKVRDKEDAKSAILYNKQNISKLKLIWNGSQEGETNDENVLEGLHPHQNLESLEIKGFRGKSFPLWTLQMSVKEYLEDRWIRLDNLLEVILSDCKVCQEIPMLGHLPRLKSVSLHHLPNVKSMSSSFYGIKENVEKIGLFPKLEKLELVDMENLTAWTNVELPCSSGTQPRGALVFARLEYLKICNCRQLISAPSHFPFLKELEIDNMESCSPLASICGSELTTLTILKISKVDGLVCLPEGLFNNNRDLSELEINRCNNMLSLVSCLRGGGSSLKKIVIEDCMNFNEFPEDLHTLHSLEEFVISECPNVNCIPYPSGKHLSSQGFTSLRELRFFECTGLTNLPCEMLESCAPSLQCLMLVRTANSTNLPQVMSILPKMPCLTELGIEIVPEVSEVFAEIAWLHNLQTLFIGCHPDFEDYVSFKASLDHIFPALPSLRVLVLHGLVHWDTLPEQILRLNTTLYSLGISRFGIQVLPEWIGNLPSLRGLYVGECPNLSRLASKNAMLGLTDLQIFNCPLLVKNVEQEASDSEWRNISHISRITIADTPFHGETRNK